MSAPALSVRRARLALRDRDFGPVWFVAVIGWCIGLINVRFIALFLGPMPIAAVLASLSAPDRVTEDTK
ncbi:hypothetical protein GCM10012275_20380 [Longimycelium tulufanense]|uniref:Uncharacterized protein n=1 Tax=Longimycelium tulufanense TaxID=907463 RepID=A0A8J3FW11_9PSEU|nr:hypothetical protein [Longimycelium tulufanense]GGM49416.1 hypothetical protein GCM10012275_20380 [Longimycelium tulufanense]